jgi:PII-like signaling protein
MAIIEMLRREGCSGATATRGVAGFGGSTRILESLRALAPDALIVVREVEFVQSGAPFKEGLPDVKVSEVMRRDVAAVHPESLITQVVELLLDKEYTRRSRGEQRWKGSWHGQRQ